MTTTSNPTAGCFIVSEGNASREEVTLASGGKLDAGTILGRLQTTGEFTALNRLGVDGENIAAAVLFAMVDATTGSKRCTVVSSDCVVSPTKLIFPASFTTQERTFALRQLRSHGIKAADSY